MFPVHAEKKKFSSHDFCVQTEIGMKVSYIEDLTLVIISYEIYETSLRRVS